MPTRSLARLAGILYVAIILLGLGSELALRGPLVGDGPDATWAAVSAHPTLFRLSILSDTALVVADIAIALVFFRLLRPVSEDIARAAMVFRLMQAAVIAASLLALVSAATLVATAPAPEPSTLARLIETHGTGYDLGLILFAVNTGLMAWLLVRSGLVPRWLPPLLWAAAAVYLVGGVTRIAAPGLNEAMQPAYVVPVIAEVALAVTLLLGGQRGAVV
ncbi:DUF4386 family protein [Rhodobacterales bacterium HKCCE2091]|nr:DUF4386 family protein [Rhodobacterales bacterium HKCCE2091]